MPWAALPPEDLGTQPRPVRTRARPGRCAARLDAGGLSQLGANRDVMRAYCKLLSGVHVVPSNINFLGGSKDEFAAIIAMYYADIPPLVSDDVVTVLPPTW